VVGLFAAIISSALRGFRAANRETKPLRDFVCVPGPGTVRRDHFQCVA
jgi:hypothetical protein